jgi:hypothetical protein
MRLRHSITAAAAPATPATAATTIHHRDMLITSRLDDNVDREIVIGKFMFRMSEKSR